MAPPLPLQETLLRATSRIRPASRFDLKAGASDAEPTSLEHREQIEKLLEASEEDLLYRLGRDIAPAGERRAGTLVRLQSRSVPAVGAASGDPGRLSAPWRQFVREGGPAVSPEAPPPLPLADLRRLELLQAAPRSGSSGSTAVGLDSGVVRCSPDVAGRRAVRPGGGASRQTGPRQALSVPGGASGRRWVMIGQSL